VLLAIDVGNSNIVLGIYDGARLVASWRAATEVLRQTDEYAVMLHGLCQLEGVELRRVSGVALSSVVPPLTETFRQLARRYLRVEPLVVEPGIRTGIRVRTDNPKEVGADRIVNALAAQQLYGTPVIVVDLGTATTLDAVSADGDYLGGAIAPGIMVALEALVGRTSRLQRIEVTRPRSAIGRNTVSAMQSGLLFGYVGLLEGLIERIQRELDGTARVVATGGLAQLLAGETSTIDVVNPDLTLEGLRLIYELNRHEPARERTHA
jgi:type III pantothenate kinase